jgi:hypothetical protein
MKGILSMAAVILATGAAFAETVNFDDAKTGTLPAGWLGGVTGSGTPKWLVEADGSAPSKLNVLKQSGEGTYPWCVKKDTSIKDGFVEVKLKPVSGLEDQAGGVVWRWQDGDNYFIARANVLEDNVRICRTVKGKRIQFGGVDMKVAGNQWHTLRVDFAGNHFKVSYDGKAVFEADDDTFKTAGAVGVWTKADSGTLFDDFSFGEKQQSERSNQ